MDILKCCCCCCLCCFRSGEEESEHQSSAEGMTKTTIHHQPPTAKETKIPMEEDIIIDSQDPMTSPPESASVSEASIDAPGKAKAGSTIDVTWKGPNYRNDYIGVSRKGETGYLKYAYTYGKNPVQMTLPAEPGLYDLKYMLEQHDDKVLAVREIELEAAEASLEAPDKAKAGSTIDVSWEGPNYRNDFIGVSKRGKTGYLTYSYIYGKKPVQVTLPAEPGLYDLKYMMEEHDDKVLAVRQIEVETVGASLEAPEKANAGSTIDVSWEGPNYKNDFIGVSKRGKTGYLTYSYIYGKKPVQVTLPAEPGLYDLKYMMEDHDDKVLAVRQIEVEAVGASLEAPDKAKAGSTIDVSWEGPNYRNDFIGVSKRGETGYLTYSYIYGKKPVQVTLPAEPGLYDLKYMMEDHDDKVLAVHQIELG